MGSDKTFGEVRDLLVKLAGQHPTEKKLKEEQHPEPPLKEDDVTVEEVGAPAVVEGREPAPVPPAPAAVSEEPSVDYSAGQELPAESKGHPTNEKLEEEPAKAAALLQTYRETGKKVEEGLAGLMTVINEKKAAAAAQAPAKPAKPEKVNPEEAKPEEAKPEATAEAPPAPEKPAQEADSEKPAKEAAPEEPAKEANSEDAKAGYQAASIIGAQMAEAQLTQKAAELQGVGDLGASEADMLSDVLDQSIAGQLAELPEEEGAAEGGVITLDELKALAESLASGQPPTTPEEQAILDILTAISGAPGAPAAPAQAEEVAEVATPAGEVEEDVEEKLAAVLKKCDSDQIMQIASQVLGSAGKGE